jgi:hypothetical protein
VTDEGQTSATLAAPGYFVADSGAAAPTIAPAGSYVSNMGAIAATLAAPGSYVADEGQTSATLAAPGYFVADSGATVPTISPAGSYVQNAGSITATLAAPGSYVAEEGQTSATLAAPGYFVADSGATAPTIAPVGYFVADQGSNQAFAAAPGFYAPEEGSVITLICPDDSTSYGAAPACRSGLISMNDPNTIGPKFDSNFGTGSIIDLGALGTNTEGTFLFEIANLTNSLGYADDLTNLTLLDAQFSGLHSDLFSLDGIVLGDVLSEQQSVGFNVDFMSLIETAFSVNLTFFTDQYATFGGSGQEFVFDIRGRFTDHLTEVPAPAHLILLLFGLGLLLLKFFAKSKKAC